MDNSGTSVWHQFTNQNKRKLYEYQWRRQKESKVKITENDFFRFFGMLIFDCNLFMKFFCR